MASKKFPSHLARVLDALLWLGVLTNSVAHGDELRSLTGHVPSIVSHLSAKGRLAATNQLRLAIGLPLRDAAGLDAFLARLYDPASPDYRHYLTPEELAARFGPTDQDYQAVREFARTNGLTVTTTYDNRLVLDVAGPAGAVESALHITLRTYQHPTEPRLFFAPDTEPTVPSGLPMADIQGLSDYARPHPRIKRMNPAKVVSRSGSAPDTLAGFIGNDFRNAYVPGTALTGAGQSVGLVEFDGFYANDIATYAATAGNGRTNIYLQTVLLDGYNGVPTTNGNNEVSLDIELAMAMAPGLTKIVAFEAGEYGNPNDILSSMLSYSSSVKQLSCSWGWFFASATATTSDAIFMNMAAAGQTFINASGDVDAFTTGSSSVNGVDNPSLQNAPSSSPYITQVGGTTLTMNGSGSSYASETVWNWGPVYGSRYDGVGSSGGISSYYPIPNWQTNISNLAGRGGSASYRNIPDVALTADDIYVVYGGSGSPTDGNGGTSCAAPLWAGFMALVNQQAAANGSTNVGFINPAIYRIAAGTNYSSCFHDVATGNNTWSSSPDLFYAQTGYDLCTGLGTPNGTGMIPALAGPVGALGISPATGLAWGGLSGGPFSPASGTFQLTNRSSSAINWSLINTSAWLTASLTGGTLAANTGTNLTVRLTTTASNLVVGFYPSSIAFTNSSAHTVQTIPNTLQVYQPLSISPGQGLAAAGPVGGLFIPAAQTFALTNASLGTWKWSLINTSALLTVSSSGGSLAPGGTTNITVAWLPTVNQLATGIYNASMIYTDTAGWVATAPFTLAAGASIVQNGGFETGDFTGWTQSGDSSDTQITTRSGYVHSGNYSAILGPPSTPGYLSQNLATYPGQTFLLSFWLSNPSGGTPNQFQALWNNTLVVAQTNLTSTAWNNFQILVAATGTVTPLQFGIIDQLDFLALDDISVTPVGPVAFKSTARLTNNFQLTWNTSTGIVYQVQYKTNLIQTSWINLGGPALAGSNTLTETDTNALRATSQRFYRLITTP
jgi:hypothetical protein